MSPTVTVPADELTERVFEVFVSCGCSAAESRRIAENLVEANLTGHDSHGVIRVPRYVAYLADGVQFADMEIDVLVDDGSLLLVDGKYGMGQTVGPQAVNLGLDRAQASGLSIVALRRAGHLGRIGAFAEVAAERSMVSLHLVNVAASQLVAPFGSADRRMGTNPVTIGVPRRDEPPIVLDFATSLVAEGKAAVALAGGKRLPDDALVGPDGLTGDPAVLYGPTSPGQRPDARRGPGALAAMGAHKGSGLAVMCELLAGALTGSGTAGPSSTRFANGMLSIYFDPDRLDPTDSFSGAMAEFADWVLDAAPLDPAQPVELPGDPERRRRRERLASGIELPQSLWDEIVAAS